MDTDAIDLASLDTVKAANEGTEIELRHPATNAALGMFVTVLGKDSDAYQKHVAERANAARTKAAKDQRRGRPADPETYEETEAAGLKLLVALTTNFRNIKVDGQLLQFTPENAKKFYVRFPWAKDQVDNAIGDYANFIKS